MKRLLFFVFVVVAIAGLSSVTLGSGGDYGYETYEAVVNPPASELSLWIWTDKYTYMPGQQMTLRGSYRNNGDTREYVAFVYIQNNQTGKRTYFTDAGPATTAQSIFGNTPDQIEMGTRRTIGLRRDYSRGSLIVGSGGTVLPAPYTIPNELGMHTVVVEFRDNLGGRVLKKAYFKIGVVDEIEEVSGNIETDQTWVNSKAYHLQGVVMVKNATLTIEPGTFITGQPGSQPASSLIVTRTGKLMAAGTRTRPITFTSSLPFGERSPGDWGGLVLLGNAEVNWPSDYGNIEGLPVSDDTRYGGDDNAHDCGTLTYVRVEFAGAELSPNNEINAITFGGCGSDTVARHLQAKYGLDDAFEWFGGTMDASHLVATYADDDYIDIQIGWTGRLQHVLAVSGKDFPGNRGIESDNNEDGHGATPITNPQVFNLTLVGSADENSRGGSEGSGVAGAYFRRGSGGSYNNILIYNWITTGIAVLDDATISNGALSGNGILMWNNGLASGMPNTLAGQVAADVGGKANKALPLVQLTPNVEIADPDLIRPLQLNDPDFRPRGGNPVFRANWIQPPDDGFFDQSANYIGAFGDERWDEEWVQYHVMKTYTPDMPGEFSGGLVQMQTIEFPVSRTFNAGLSYGFNSRSTFKQFRTYRGGESDFWGFDGGSRSLPGLVPEERLYPGSYSRDEFQEFGRSFPVNWEGTSVDSARPSQSYSFGGGDTVGPLGLVGAFAFTNKPQIYQEARRYLVNVGGGNVGIRTDYPDFARGVEASRMGAVMNAALRLNSSNKIVFRNTYTHDADKEARRFEGFNGGIDVDIVAERLRWVERGLFSTGVEGEHNLPALGNSLLRWQYTYSRSGRDEPDFRETIYQREGDGTLAFLALPQSAIRFYNTLDDKIHEPLVEWGKPFFDPLPGVNVSYALTPRQNLRFGCARTLNRPDFRELSPFDFLNVLGGFDTAGNPDLRRAKIDNYDARWEWFLGGDQVVAASYFLKEFTDPIETIVQPTTNQRRILRRDPETQHIPIMILSARSTESDKVLGLELGANDYMTKPFGVRELVARVRSTLRKNDGQQVKSYNDGRLEMHFENYEIRFEGENRRLTLKEFGLLKALVVNAGRALTRERILNAVWGYSYYGDARTVDVHIRRIRRKLGPNFKDYIETVTGVGYRFRRPAQQGAGSLS